MIMISFRQKGLPCRLVRLFTIVSCKKLEKYLAKWDRGLRKHCQTPALMPDAKQGGSLYHFYGLQCDLAAVRTHNLTHSFCSITILNRNNSLAYLSNLPSFNEI